MHRIGLAHASALCAMSIICLAPAAEETTGGGAGDDAAHDRKYICKLGDTIFTVAAETLGDSDLWPQIMEANPKKVRLANGHPKVIQTGETFTIPRMTTEQKTAAVAENHKRWAKDELVAQVPEHLRKA